MEVAKRVLDFLDLKLIFDKQYKRISIEIFARTTNILTYVLSSNCFPKKNIENFLKDVVLGLRSACDSDGKFEERSV